MRNHKILKRKTVVRCPQGDPEVGILWQRLQAPVVTLLHVMKENTLEMNGKIENLIREIETAKKNWVETVKLKG